MTTAKPAPARLVRVVRGKDKPGCLILPGAGGGLIPYLRLASALGGSHAVNFVRPLGLMPGEEPEQTVAQMADSVLEVLDEAKALPQLVVGWSLGGLVAWELCVRLGRRRGLRPELVVVDSSPLPRVPEPGEDGWIRAKMVAELGPNAAPDTVDRVVRTFEAQAAALTDYRAEPGHEGRLQLLMCSPYETDGREDAVRHWREIAPQLELGQLDAGHYEVFDPAHLPQLTTAISGFLGRTGEGQEK